MTKQDKTDVIEVAIAFAAFLIVFFLGAALLGIDLFKVKPDPCLPSHSVIIDGKWTECVNEPTNYKGWYPRIEK